MSPPVKQATASGPVGAVPARSGETVAVDTVTVVGARGGSGTSTVAAVLALTGRTMVRTELVAGEPAQLAALIGVDIPVGIPVEILPGLRLASEPNGTAELTVIDAGHLSDGVEWASRRPGEQRLGVVRGPCYLAVRAVVDAGWDLDGLVLVAERGRALTERDVSDATRLDIVATIPADPAIARAIDAGLLATRATHQRQLQPLQRWLTDRLDPFPSHVSATAEPAPATPSKIDTDLPGAQKRTWRCRVQGLQRAFGRCVEHREAEPRGGRVLRR